MNFWNCVFQSPSDLASLISTITLSRSFSYFKAAWQLSCLNLWVWWIARCHDMIVFLYLIEALWNRPSCHDDVINWRHFPRYWPFVRGIHRSPVKSPHKGQWRGALMFSLICVWINGWVNSRESGDLRRNCAHYDVIVMQRRHWVRTYHACDCIVSVYPGSQLLCCMNE